MSNTPSGDNQSGDEQIKEARLLAAQTITGFGNLSDDEKLEQLNEIIHLLASAERENQTTKSEEDIWNENNEPFSYEPPEDPPEHWDSKEFTELYDRVIRKDVQWVCSKCPKPFNTLKKARRHVRKHHGEKLIDSVKAKADYGEENTDENEESDESESKKDIEARRENNSQLSEWEKDE
jgi:hypothetical protein